MRYRMLGSTGTAVSELCLGTMTFGVVDDPRYSVVAGLDQAAVNELVAQALDAGINYFDTADSYSLGESERLLGQSLRDLGVARRDVVLATKFFSTTGQGPNNRGGSRPHIIDAVKASLSRLNTDYIDHYQMHAFDPWTPMEETLRALDDLVSEGLVRYVGCSNWRAWQLVKALGISERHGWIRFETIQSYYSLPGREIERELVPALLDRKVGLTVWSPLAGGWLSGKYGGANPSTDGRRNKVPIPVVDPARGEACIGALREVAARHGATPAQVAIAWLLTRPAVNSVIIGAKNPAQLADNIGACALALSGEDLARLEEVSALPEEYPDWMRPYQNPVRER